MPYGMDAFMLGIGMLGKPPVSPAALPPLPAVPGSSLEVYSGSGGAAKGSAPCAGPSFAIATCPLVAPGKTANVPPLPCGSRAAWVQLGSSSIAQQFLHVEQNVTAELSVESSVTRHLPPILLQAF